MGEIDHRSLFKRTIVVQLSSILFLPSTIMFPVRALLLGGVALTLLATSMGVMAADAARPGKVKAGSAAPAHDWTGLYFGAGVGFGRGLSNATLWDTNSASAGNRFGGMIGGIQGGYNLVLPSNLLLGVKADLSFPYVLDSNSTISSLSRGPYAVTEKMDYVGTARGRIGHVFNPWIIYATAGLAWAQGRFLNDMPSGNEEKVLHIRPGWVAGVGAEYAFSGNWSLRLEYLYSRFGKADVTFPSGGRYSSTMDFQMWHLGLNRKFDWPGAPEGSLRQPRDSTRDDNWELHGQTTYIQQADPAFRAPYSGTNSLMPWAQTRETWTTSAFLGVRVWDGGELYFNPELFQGFGLSGTVGLAGFSNGEAQKSGFAYPHFSASRLFFRQTFGLGGVQETLESAQNQLADKVDVSRLTVQVGKFPVSDLFDGNTYARDSRNGFMNWAIWAAGAFDYAADRVGLGYGATAELNQKNWALRAGYFLMDAESNSDDFDMRLFQRGEYLTELETRYQLFSQSGKLRMIGWLNSAFMGRYSEALAESITTPNYPDITLTRQGRIKYGYVFNIEQSITNEIGVFGRWSWNDGKNEIMAFTDIDASLSGGVSIRGKSWGRPDDTVGIAGAVNALSADHREFIAAGGLGILIGDGRLNYHPEQIIEAYYAYAVDKVLTLTFDYQLIDHPAYNADRGPVSIFSGRLHAEF